MKDIQGGLMFIHPSLEVIICKACLDFYGNGLYKTDKKGDDVYCRWCAQGGTIYCCSKCSVAFCKKCIDRNLKTDKKVMTDINKDTWACFICVSKPLWYLRAFCWAVQQYQKELSDDSRKRKLSTSSVDSTEKFNKPGPASAKKAFAGPASKKLKLETPSPVAKKPGPASKTIHKPEEPETVDVESDDDLPLIQTRHKKIDYSEKIEFPISSPKPRKPPARKSASAKKPVAKKGRTSTRKSYIPDVSSEEEFDDFEEEDEKSVPLETEVIGPVETIVEQVFDFCFKLSNNLNTKLMKYKLFYKGNLNTSDKINSACVNLHMDLKKVVRLYNAIDEKMMTQLDAFNVAQEELEKHKLALDEPVEGDIDMESYGIDPKTPETETVVDTEASAENNAEFDTNEISEQDGEKENDTEMGRGSPNLLPNEKMNATEIQNGSTNPGEGNENDGLSDISDKSTPESFDKISNKVAAAENQTNGHAPVTVD